MPRFHIGKVELSKILKVFLWSVGSAIVALLLALVDAIEIPAQYAFVVPIINTILYSIKEWITNNQ